MTRLIFGFALTILVSCNQPIKTYQPDTNQIKSFFSQIDDSVLTKGSFLLVDTVQLKWKNLFVQTTSYQKALSSSDIDFIANQIEQTPATIWTNSMFDSARIVSNSYITSFNKRTAWIPIHYKFSFPYFTKDKKHCILYYDKYCGSLCAEQSLRLYKYENGKWTLIKVLFSFVS